MGMKLPACGDGLLSGLGLCLVAAIAACVMWISAFVVPASATGWSKLASGTARVASDGTRYLAWQGEDAGPVTVFDSRTHHSKSIVLPKECVIADEWRGTEDEHGLHASSGRFLVFCPERLFELLEVATGRLRPVPGTIRGQWGVVGSRYVEGFDARNVCHQTSEERARREPCLALYDLATGVVSDRPQWQVGDLDQRGAPLICPALRREVPGPGVRAGTYSHGILGQATSPVELFRCNRHRTYLKTFGEPRSAVLAGGVFTWDDGQRPPENFRAPREPRHVVLSSYRVGTHQRRDFPLPRLRLTLAGTPGVLHGVFGYSTHTAYAVFWVATETLSSGMEPFTPMLSAIYTAPL